MPILSRVKINFIVREIDCGPGFAISLAKDVIGKEPFMLYLSDELVLAKEKSCAQQLIDAYEKYQKPVMAIQPVPNEFVRRYGIIDGKKIAKGIYSVTNIIEKPEPQDAPSNLSFMGSAILTKEVFEEIERQREKGNFDVVIPYTFKPLFESGKMIACEIKGKRQDMGNKFGFIKANIEAGLEREDIKDELAEYIKQLAKTL
jgi:UTP--glucose-1-phosphate uridylyltransferase